MKTFLAMAVVLAAGLTVYAQSFTGDDLTKSLIRRGLLDSRNQSLITAPVQNPNVIRHGSVSYSGMAVQFIQSDNKLQLINPAAPPQYGSSWDNLIGDPSPELGASPAPGNSGHEGLKLFSVEF
jgi:hypothetical protein